MPISDAVINAIKDIRKDANSLNDDELLQIKNIIEAEVNTQVDQAVALANREAMERIQALELDVNKISNALTDPLLDATATTTVIGGIVGVEPIVADETGTDTSGELPKAAEGATDSNTDAASAATGEGQATS